MERKHFLYMMSSILKAPAASGDTLSWFSYYKWEPDVGETFVPTTEGHDLKEGDILWFVMDNQVWGYVPLLRTDQAMTTGVQELWYDAAKITKCIRPFPITSDEKNGAWLLDGCLPGDGGEKWIERVKQLNLSVSG